MQKCKVTFHPFFKLVMDCFRGRRLVSLRIQETPEKERNIELEIYNVCFNEGLFVLTGNVICSDKTFRLAYDSETERLNGDEILLFPPSY
jgi:hypothetical protein